MQRFRLILQGSRPLTWALSVCPVLIAAICAHMDVYFTYNPLHRMSQYSTALVILCAVVGLSLQISANFANDYIDGVKGVDAARSEFAPQRLNSAKDGLNISRNAAFACSLVGIIAGLTAISLSKQYWIMLIGLISLCAAWAYSQWLSSLGLGEILAFIFFGPVIVWCTEWILIHSLGPWAILAGIQCGILNAVVLLVNNMRDHYSDQAAGKKTLVVRWGFTIAQRILMISLGVILVSNIATMIGILIALQFHVGAWIILLHLLCTIFECVLIMRAGWNTARAQNRPKLYRYAFYGCIALMVLELIHYCVVIIVVNAL